MNESDQGRPETAAAADLPPEALERARQVTELVDLVSSAWKWHALDAAVELGIPDALLDRRRGADDVAAEIGAHAPSVRRLLRALGALGLVDEPAPGVFELTRSGSMLRTDVPDSVHGMVDLQRRSLEGWLHLAECVRAGAHAAKLLTGVEDPYGGVKRDPETRAAFDRAMVDGTKQIAGAVLLAYDFSGIAKLVDVGGGYGALLPPILRTHGALEALVFDLPECEAGALRVFEKTGIAERCDFVAGDFFRDALPADADAYVLKSILHGFDDEQSVKILGRCRAAMRPDGRVLVIEMVVPERLTPDDAAYARTDLNMLVSTGGIERTEREYRALLEAAGLRIERVVPTLGGVSVVDARCTSG